MSDAGDSVHQSAHNRRINMRVATEDTVGTGEKKTTTRGVREAAVENTAHRKQVSGTHKYTGARH